MSTYSNVFCQGIDFDKISYGIGYQYNVPDGDLKKFYGNSSGVGLNFDYDLGDGFFLSASATGFYMKPMKTDSRLNLPKIIMINCPLLLRYNFYNSGFVNIGCAAGIENNTMVFTGEAADIMDDNYIEHEFGINVKLIFQHVLCNGYALEFSGGYQKIFSVPETITIFSIGAKLLFL